MRQQKVQNVGSKSLAWISSGLSGLFFNSSTLSEALTMLQKIVFSLIVTSNFATFSLQDLYTTQSIQQILSL